MRSTRNTIAAALLFTMALASSAFAVRQVHTGKAASAVTVVTESEISFIGSTSFQNLPGATATITVPAGQVQLVQAEQRRLDLPGFLCRELLQAANSRGRN